MEFVGLIAEYDPFHNGHAAQLEMLREQGAGTVAVCLSAGATQRGELPFLPQHARVQAALAGGADLVVALPAPYACAGAEAFAEAGVALLAALGCDTLAFGAETPDTALLLATARLLQSEPLQALLRQKLRQGLPFAAARAAAAEQLQPGAGALLARPNDILGIEYGKALLRSGMPMSPLALPRVGAAHGAQGTGSWRGHAVASGSALRARCAQQGPAAWEGWVPPACRAFFRTQDVLDPARVEVALLARLRGRTAAQLAGVRGMTEGLEHRLANALREAVTLPGLYAALATRRYPNARLRRLVLDAALGVPPELTPRRTPPPWLHVLGARKAALPLLRRAALPVSTSLRELERVGPAAAQVAALYADAADLAALCRSQPAPGGLLYTQKPALL